MAQTIVMRHFDKTRIFRVFKRSVRVSEKSVAASGRRWRESLRDRPRFATTLELAHYIVTTHVKDGWEIISDTRNLKDQGVKHCRWLIDTTRDGDTPLVL